MNGITFNILPENFKPLPIVLRTASTYFRQGTTEYGYKEQDFYQLLIILDGKGSVYTNGEKYVLKKGGAFFTSKYTQSKYVNEGGLISAFLTVRGDGMPQLIEHFGWGAFEFFPSVDVEKYVEDIKEKDFY